MDLSLEKILTYLLGSIGGVTGVFYGFKYLYDLLEKRAEKKRIDKRTSEEKAYDAVWRLYEAAKAENEKLKKEIDDLEKDDSLSRPAVQKIYQAVRKLGKQIQILDTMFVSEIHVTKSDNEMQLLKDALEKEIEILWQKYNDLESCLP